MQSIGSRLTDGGVFYPFNTARLEMAPVDTFPAFQSMFSACYGHDRADRMSIASGKRLRKSDEG